MTYVLAAIIFLALGAIAAWLYNQKTREAFASRLETLELQKEELQKSVRSFSSMYEGQLKQNEMFKKLVHCIEGPTQFEGDSNQWEVYGTNGFLRQGILYPTIDITKNPNIIVVNKTTKEVKVFNYSGKFGVLSRTEQEAAKTSQQIGGVVSREQVEATITQAKQPGQTIKTAMTHKGK